MTEINSKPQYGALLTEGGKSTNIFQQYLDDIQQRFNTFLLGSQVTLTSYTISDLPPATTAGGLIFVSDETGGPVLAFSDGANWLRCTDRQVVS